MVLEDLVQHQKDAAHADDSCKVGLLNLFSLEEVFRNC